MTSRLQNSIIIAVVSLASLFLLSPVAFAQSEISFSVSPTIFDMTANPGQAWKTTVRVINPNSFELRVYIQVANFTPHGESGVPAFTALPPTEQQQGATFAEWIFAPESMLIPAEQTIEVPIVVSVPENSDPGGHYAAIMIGTKPPEGNLEESQVSTSQIISSLLFLRVTGDIHESAFIRSFRSARQILHRPETSLELRIENQGNVHIQPQGEIQIFNMWGQERGVVPINKKTLFGNVLPESVRKFSFDWSTDWSIADIGRYTAKASLSYGNENRQSMTAETSFWVVPWKWVLLTLGAIAVFIYGFILAVRIYVERVLYLSGFSMSEDRRQSAVSITPKAKRLSVVAPLEMGLLDLRQQLRERKSPGVVGWFKAVVSFMFVYKKFFWSLLGALLFIWLLVWYWQQGVEDREFRVITEEGVTLTSGDLETSQNEKQSANKTIVTIINKSNDSSVLSRVKRILEDANYAVSIETEDTTQSADRTVITFSPSLTNQALELSSLLQNAPLSALPASTDEDPELTVYLGRDVLEQE